VGYYKDLGTGIVAGFDDATGYPKDKYGHLLDPGEHEGIKAGIVLNNLTSPYGFLEYAIGNGDDFVCMDYNITTTDQGAKFLILHSVVNSETGGFIDRFEYDVIHLIDYDYDANAITDRAIEWCYDNGLKHNVSGWNQEPYYFARCAHLDFIGETGEPSEVPEFTEREKRMGGKRINQFCKVGI
jgi:hypothetical protein